MSARYSRYVYLAAALLVLTAGYATWRRTALIWDGAYQFNTTLIMQRPYYFLTRFHTFFLWMPTVWASRHTDNLFILQAIYGAPFLLAPVVGLLLSWWMVRRDAPHLIIWAMFGLAAGTLPGQIFVINDSIFQLHLFWPIFLGLFVPLSWPKKIVLAVLMVFQFPHQLGTVLFAGAAAATLIVGWRLQGAEPLPEKPTSRQMFIRSGLMAVLCLIALAKIIISSRIPELYDSYAVEEMKYSVAMQRWRTGVAGWPLAGLMFMWAAGAGLFVCRIFSRRGRESHFVAAAVASLLCIGGGALCWIHWASNGELWWKALDYRRWVGPLTAPFFILAALEAFRGARAANAAQDNELTDGQMPAREPAVVLLAAVFMLVLGLQSRVWGRYTDALMSAVNKYASVVVPQALFENMKGTPLDHWGIADYVVAVQSKTPMKLFLDPRSEKLIYKNPPQIPHQDFYENQGLAPRPPGFFDLRPLLTALSKEPHHEPHQGPERSDLKTTPN